jgi:hypothetical protein
MVCFLVYCNSIHSALLFDLLSTRHKGAFSAPRKGSASGVKKSSFSSRFAVVALSPLLL